MTEKEYINTFNKIIETVNENHDVEKIKTINDDFYKDLNFSSLSLVEFLILCEYKFSKNFYDGMLPRVATVKELIEMIEKE